MKNKFIMVTLFSAFLLIVPNVKAANFPDNQTVDKSKIWTIEFTSEVGFDDTTKQSITVMDSNNNKVNVDVQLGQDHRTILVTAPQGGYTVGESYILNIGSKAHSSKGIPIKSEHKLHFNIKNNTEIVTFKDKNLEQVVREKINKPTGDIYGSDVKKITELNANNKKISDLEGIQHLSNLDTLFLIDNNISDINQLQYVTKLRILQLMNNQIQDINPLKNLTYLTYLCISGNKISDIMPISHLTRLQDLLIDNNNIVDLSPISNLTNLHNLSACDNEITDISALNKLTNLEGLYLRFNRVEDINVLSNFTNLETLQFGNNRIKDISALGNLESLKDVQLIDNGIEDISPISSNINLKNLSFFSNQVKDISSLKNLRNLEFLTFDYDKILPDLEFLKNFPSLKETIYMGQFTEDKWEDKSYNNITSHLKRYNDLLIKADRILSETLHSDMTEYEKELAIHDYIIKHTDYVNGSICFDGSGAFYQTLTEGKAVCQGYAEALNLLLNRAGIESSVIYGNILNNDGSKGMGHAWNIVKVNGKYYHIDATWNDGGKDPSYDYFNISDEEMSKNRTWDKDLYPICSDRLSN